jgi:hypothetical protein
LKSATSDAKLDPIAPIAQHEQVTYATQRLTKALQDLIARSTEVTAAPQSIAADRLQIAIEIERFLEEKQSYAERTRDVSEGWY